MSALLYDLELFDISTNKLYFTTHHTVPIGGVHPTMGLAVQRHPDIADAIELVSIQIGTAAHKHIRAWKRNLRGYIITAINGSPIKSRAHIEHAVSEARTHPSKCLNIEFGSLTAFTMSGEGVPTLQADQLNVIAHHLHTTKTKEDLWTDKSDWPIPIDSPDVMTERLKISRLTRRRVQQLEPNVWVFFDHHLQIKNAFAVKGQDSSPLYHSTGNFKGFRACLGSYCFPSWRKF